MPEFYIIFARKIFSDFFFWGGGGTCLPIRTTFMAMGTRFRVKKNLPYFGFGNLATLVRLQYFLAHSLVGLYVIERWFHFPPHLSSATVLPWKNVKSWKW